MTVGLAPQVADFVRRLAPEPRRRFRQALRDLEGLDDGFHPLA
jgi:hypothetical protein